MGRPILLGVVFDTWWVLKFEFERGILWGAIPFLLGMWAGRLAGARSGVGGCRLGRGAMRLPPAVGKPAETGGMPESIRVFLRAKRWGRRQASASAFGSGRSCGLSNDCLRPLLAQHQIPALVPCTSIFLCDVKDGVGSGRKRCYEEKSDHLGLLFALTAWRQRKRKVAGLAAITRETVNTTQTAADMSRCGTRPAESRPGDYWRTKVKARTHRQICANDRNARTYELFWASRLSQQPLYLVNGRRAMHERPLRAGGRPLRTSAAGQERSVVVCLRTSADERQTALGKRGGRPIGPPGISWRVQFDRANPMECYLSAHVPTPRSFLI